MTQCRACEWDGKCHHCSACHATFGAMCDFDDHRRGSFEPLRRYCLSTTALGLTLGLIPDPVGGVWRTPEGLERVEAKRVQLARVTAARRR